MEWTRGVNTPEYIICSAIHYDNGIQYAHQPFNIETGMVFCGLRHNNCFGPLLFTFPDRDKRDVKQGFLTSKNRYVDRVEAAKIAIERGQTSDDVTSLHSEDLY